jgi:cysteinyl-tRNA synthetase
MALDATDEVIINLIHDFIGALNDDLNSPAALEKLNQICIEVKNGKKISQADNNHVCNLLGIDV